MKRILFLSLLGIGLCGLPATAQQAGGSQGQFEVAGSSPAMQVRYHIMHALPHNLVVQLQAPAPLKFESAITDQKGKILIPLPGATLQGRYVQNMDISGLPAGQYYLRISYGSADQESFSIPFSK